MSVGINFPGNVNELNVLGGAPYFLLQSMKVMEEDCVGINLDRGKYLAARRYCWNAFEVMMMRGVGGFQYSERYLDRIWRSVQLERYGVLINMFQMFPKRVFSSKCSKVFYIDMTLSQLFQFYDTNFSISPTHKIDAVSEERQQYSASDLVICQSVWAAESVLADYNLPKNKVEVILPGGNVYRENLAELSGSELVPPCTGPLRFLFVGKDPVRKGLFRFMEAMLCLPGSERYVALTVIGVRHDDVPLRYRQLPGVSWLGFHDKANESQRFTEILRNHDVGILLSTAEASGLSLREFQMLGLAVLAPNVGGCPEMIVEGAGELIGKDEPPERIAGIITELVHNREVVAKMREVAWSRRAELTWDQTASKMLHLLRERGLLARTQT